MSIGKTLMLFITFLILPLLFLMWLFLLKYKDIELLGCLALILIVYPFWGFLFDFYNYFTKELKLIKSLGEEKFSTNQYLIESNMRFWYLVLIFLGIYSIAWILIAVALPIISKKYEDLIYLTLLPLVLFNNYRFVIYFRAYRILSKKSNESSK